MSFNLHYFIREAAVLKEIKEDRERQEDLERMCHDPDMLRIVEQQIGIFFAREDN